MKKELLLGELRAKVLDTANLLPVYGLVWMAGGTVIAHDPDTGYIVVTPSGWLILVKQEHIDIFLIKLMAP